VDVVEPVVVTVLLQLQLQLVVVVEEWVDYRPYS
jgi:hypothetical protein